MRELVRVTSDLFDIADRLREIDPGYEVYYNRKSSRFEIHSRGALQIAVPFDRLDARTVEHVRRTRVENAARLIAELEARNAAAERNASRLAVDRALAAAGI